MTAGSGPDLNTTSYACYSCATTCPAQPEDSQVIAHSRVSPDISNTLSLLAGRGNSR